MTRVASRLRAAFIGSLAAVSLAALASCDRLWLDTYWRDERYVLMAVDTVGQMNLGFDCKDGTSTGLVGPTVFAVGADNRYIVAKQHPASNAFGTDFDRSVTNYYVIERTTSPDFKERLKRVRGPMQFEEFNQLTKTLSLPRFSTVINELE